jgi:hypothetical protein
VPVPAWTVAPVEVPVDDTVELVPGAGAATPPSPKPAIPWLRIQSTNAFICPEAGPAAVVAVVAAVEVPVPGVPLLEMVAAVAVPHAATATAVSSAATGVVMSLRFLRFMAGSLRRGWLQDGNSSGHFEFGRTTGPLRYRAVTTVE